MNELNRLSIKNSESNTEHGFYFVEFENGKSLQCCLVSSKKNDFEEQYFHNQIEIGNSGYSEGLCADCNEWAAKGDEWAHIEEFLIEVARCDGVQIIA